MKQKNIALETTNKVLSANTGLILFEKLFTELKLAKRLEKILPKKKRNKGPSQINKFKSLLYAFAAGADSISDLDTLCADELFTHLTDGGVASRTLGDFLRLLSDKEIALLQELLVDIAFILRKSLYPKEDFILSMDSTPHEHYAKKMEGIAWNYKNMWCLDSQNAYDQYGFSYLFDLRPGNTHSSVDSEVWARKIFSRIPKALNRYFRGDSAYGTNDMYHALQAEGVKFTIVLKSNVSKVVRANNKNLLTWKKTKINFFESDECEVAMGFYSVEHVGTFRVVFIRAPKIDYQPDMFEDFDDLFLYYSIITNIGSDEMSDEDIIKFYSKRADAENFIREQKYGFDFLNFPCQKLSANNVYGLVGTFCHNMMRYLSYGMSQKVKSVRGKDGKIRKVVQQGYYAKYVRNNLIKLPCQVVCHARKIVLKINQKTKEVLDKVIMNINLQSSLPAS